MPALDPALHYSYTDTEFILSPDTEILRSLAQSLYPKYLSRLYQEGKEINPHPIPALDKEFVESSEALWFRVLAETVYTQLLFKRENIQHTVLWFGSARLGTPGRPKNAFVDHYYQEAQDLAERLTRWSIEKGSKKDRQPFTICTGGGPGIMEAGNMGAKLAGGRSMGLNIHLPKEQDGNPHITEGLQVNFQYFFTRKFYFLRRAKAAVVFPGGYGSFDELFETLTLIQTQKMNPIKIILYGEKFWKEVVNFENLLKHGMISENDLTIFEYQDNVESAFQSLTKELTQYIPRL